MDQDVIANSSNGGFTDLPGIPLAKSVDEKVGRDLYMKPILYSHIIYTVPDGWIYWMSWGTIQAGDCRMLGARLNLYPDGNIFFQASTTTSSDGDVWLIKGIQFFDQFGHPVGHPIPQHNGMNMAWEGSEYPIVFWDAIPGVSASSAAQIRSAAMTNHC